VEVKTIGIIGARTPGKELAAAALLAGYAVILEDVSPEMLADGVKSVEAALSRGAQNDAHLQRLQTSRSVEDVTRVADMLIEALPEELEAKLEIFTIFDKFAKPGAILASTSRETPIFDLADMTYRPEECVGFRFANHASTAQTAAQTIEITRAHATSNPTVATCQDVARKMKFEATIIEEPHA
jgi:3-hydroxybutyryl-CoA dehydrogenase